MCGARTGGQPQLSDKASLMTAIDSTSSVLLTMLISVASYDV
jgi:hypothetical protein